MRGGVARIGGGRKPNQHKLVSESFAVKSAVLAFYDTHQMPVVVDTFWPGVNPKSTAYKSKAECSKVLACSGEKEPKLTPPDRKRVLCWLHAAWSGLSTTSVKGGFKRIDLLFDGRDNTPSRSVESTEVEDGLVDALQALS
ncbi:hypothetical protein PF001_g11272 [Phytophthora fragariae]|uniref:DDE-1 domain-containing protein n=1 Tax=Phytophthora fragariae TaxID=53985 RepID=A0A6A4DVA8_9STRA|nr:hypothetical protein PF004_g9137 [Phytophthora fragariae]KAE9308197.1 hypothetical protein PF001_g11272 [Phytophthora fragariae]